MRLLFPTTVFSTLVGLLSFLEQAPIASADSLHSWLAVNPISTSSKTIDPLVGQPSSRNLLLSNPNAFTRCPANCSETGDDPYNWAAFHSIKRLKLCNQTTLLSFNLYNNLEDPEAHVSIRACTADHRTGFSTSAENNKTSEAFSDDVAIPIVQHNAVLQLAWISSESSGSASDVVTAIEQIDEFLANQSPQQDFVSFASSGENFVGVFAGSEIQAQGLVSSILRSFAAEVTSRGISDSLLVQLCGGDLSSKYAFGIVVNAESDLPFVQRTVRGWMEGQCSTSFNESSTWKSIDFSTPRMSKLTDSTDTISNSTHISSRGFSALQPRADTTCSTTQVYPRDTCTSLAAECGITLAEFTDYNPSPTCTSPLTVRQHVCCSAGTLPDFAPKQYANGTCSTYLVQLNDSCNSLAASYSLTLADLESYNNNT